MATCEHCGNEHEGDPLFCTDTGKLIAGHLLAPGTLLDNKYRIGEALGVGAIGAVFRARHELLDKDVAIKVLLSAEGHAVERLLREAKVASTTRHPNIALVTDAGKTPEGSPYVVMELVAGETLEAIIDGKPLAPERALDLTVEILSGLEAVHRLGVVHRDLKPENLMVVPREGGGEGIKILDFGMSKVSEVEHPDRQALTVTGAVLGTPLYMAPEQAKALPDIGPPADLWAVGAILYAMLTGRPPHEETNVARLIAAKLRSAIEPPSSLVANLGGAFDELVLRALALEPEDRFADATAMLAALQELRAGALASTLTGGTTGPLQSAERRSVGRQEPARDERHKPNTEDMLPVVKPASSTPSQLEHLDAHRPTLPMERPELDDDIEFSPPQVTSAARSAPRDALRGGARPTVPATPRGLGSASQLRQGSEVSRSQTPTRPAMSRSRISGDARARAANGDAASIVPPHTGPFRQGEDDVAPTVPVMETVPAMVAQHVSTPDRSQEHPGASYGGSARRVEGRSRLPLILTLIAALALLAGGGFAVYRLVAKPEIALRVITRPTSASVRVDGQLVRQMPVSLPRSKRAVQITVSSPGLVTKKVTVIPDNDITLHFDLFREVND